MPKKFKIFDCFIFNKELDLLEIRLHELAPLVDHFVLIEARQTFQGAPKPLVFSENRDLFRAFDDKIIPIVIDFPKILPSRTGSVKKDHSRQFADNWNREHYQRDQVIEGLNGAQPDDIVMMSDVDELPRLSRLQEILAKRRKGSLTCLEMSMSRYFIDRHLPFEQKFGKVGWIGTKLIEYRYFSGGENLKQARLSASSRSFDTFLGRLHTRLFNYSNFGIGRPICLARDAGWHLCSEGGWDAWRHKINSFAHEDYKDIDTYKSEAKFVEHVEQGTSPIALADLPPYVQKFPKKFCFFADYKPFQTDE